MYQATLFRPLLGSSSGRYKNFGRKLQNLVIHARRDPVWFTNITLNLSTHNRIDPYNFNLKQSATVFFFRLLHMGVKLDLLS
jgi:hypothetical protein